MIEVNMVEVSIEELLDRLKKDIDSHYNGGECLSDKEHFELWDKMFELKKKRLVLDNKTNL